MIFSAYIELDCLAASVWLFYILSVDGLCVLVMLLYTEPPHFSVGAFPPLFNGQAG
jgi:hypothetical protein